MNREELAEKYGVDKEDVTCSKCKFGLTIVAGPPKFIHCDKKHAWGSDVWCESYEYKWGKEIMTCTHDCSRCPHGTTEILKGICIGPNTTCNGNCSNCQFYIVLKYKVNCGLRG